MRDSPPGNLFIFSREGVIFLTSDPSWFLAEYKTYPDNLSTQA